MSTDQSMPRPASSSLAGSADVAEPAADVRHGEPSADVGPGELGADVGPGEPSAVGPGEPIAESGASAEVLVEQAPSRPPAGSTWQAEASGQLVAMSFPGARRVAGWLFWVIFPLLCLAAIHTSVTNVVHHLGNKPVGIRGTFVVQPRSCSQGFCSFGGLFSSDDHTIRNLPLLGDPRWHPAEVHRVTYDPRSVEAIALPGHWDPTPSVMAAFGALTYLVVIGYFLREHRRSDRAARTRQPAAVG
jgi:hypothetical protein